MGILKLFKKNKSNFETKEIKIEEIENWLLNFIDTSGLDEKISTLKRELYSKTLRLNEALNELEDAKLKDDKIIPERVKSIFEGNRKAFIEKIRMFMLELKIPENRENLDEFLEITSEKLNAVSEDTQKNYFILKEFVEDQIRPIVSKIKDIDLVISNARANLEKTPLSKIKEIRLHHKKYYFLLSEIENLSEELEHTLKMKLSEMERKSKFDSKLEQLKTTKAYTEYTDLLDREKQITVDIRKTENDIRELFSKIEYALKKRFNNTENELLEKYTTNSVKALVEDATLSIITEISHIKNNIHELAIKKEKEESIVNALKNVENHTITSLRNKMVSLEEELTSVVSRLKDNHYERSMKEREKWVDSINKNIEAIEKKQKDIEELIERLEPKFVKQKIRDLLRLLDEKVELK
jgi:hypothetical protein